MVLHKYGDMLYKGLQQVVDEHLKGIADEKVVAANDDQFLGSLRAVWNDHKVSMLMIRDILMYMVRFPSPHDSLASYACSRIVCMLCIRVCPPCTSWVCSCSVTMSPAMRASRTAC